NASRRGYRTMADQKKTQHASRAHRTRGKIKRVSTDRPRLSVHRSSKNITAQVIDDKQGKTLVSASSLEKEFGKGSDKEAAAKIGKLIAERAVEAGVKDVVFDRGGYIFHG